MNTDDFEQRLARTPLRPPPAAWRAEILETARAGMVEEGLPRLGSAGFGWCRGLRARIARISAPWVALGPAWAVILVLHGAAGWLGGDSSRRPEAEPDRARSITIEAARSYQSRIVVALDWMDGDMAVEPSEDAEQRPPNLRGRGEPPGAGVLQPDHSPARA